ncbi:universal stress protein [Pseudenhygromyxa sp. WMMC2535]|uniref:universal stress protein n=1 Tax=Pseudenhygromyxa sp. WMMC2535 TaxID=2712867 RepID=UPI001555FCD9|nr:universal stress protein [Pseudenhygromyxa sp. WMMC2535]NVB37765.1 universal stress protein [Pseudenhygromyxa sp. WMMC2535]
MSSSSSWILGLDLREGAEGPLVFARWLQAELDKTGDASLVPVHVIEQDQLGLLASADKREQAVSLAEDAVASTLQRAGDETPLTDLQLVDAGTPEDVLASKARAASGLIIGRLAPRGKDQLLRLGGVARRLLRKLTAPTLVVPPDLRAADVGKGPIILACDAQEDSLGAARFALELADELRRELILAHVVPMPYGWSVGYLPAESVKQVRADLRTRGERTLERWATQHGITGLRGVVTEGIVPEELGRLAAQEKALMIVSGSRKLNAVERLFVTSVGSELAASAVCPVAVVPPDYGS